MTTLIWIEITTNHDHIDLSRVYHLNTLILIARIIWTTQKLHCTDILFMGRKFLERKFLLWKFLQFQPLYPKLVLVNCRSWSTIMNTFYFKSCFISMFLSNQCKNPSITRTDSTKNGRKLSNIFEVLNCKKENSANISSEWNLFL